MKPLKVLSLERVIKNTRDFTKGCQAVKSLFYPKTIKSPIENMAFLYEEVL